MTFLSIDKEEMQVLMAYFKQSGIKARFLDSDGHQREALDSGSDEEGAAAGTKRSSRARTKNAEAIDADMDDDEESEDEDFVDNGSDDSDDDEEGEEEQSEDMSMIDESVDKDELKALSKNEQATGKRRRPGQK